MNEQSIVHDAIADLIESREQATVCGGSPYDDREYRRRARRTVSIVSTTLDHPGANNTSPVIRVEVPTDTWRFNV